MSAPTLAETLDAISTTARDRVYDVMGIRPTHPYGTLIAERIRAALAAACEAQRKADAAVCINEQVDAAATGQPDDGAYNQACEDCAAAILRGGEE